MDHILYNIYIYIYIYIYKAWGKTVNRSMKIYTNKIKNRMTFKIYYLKLLTPETINYLEALKVR